jgi:Bacterial Ig-like domain
MVLNLSWISRRFMLRLILFLLPISCSQPANQADISLLHENHQATAIIIPLHYFFHASDDSIKETLTVHLSQDTEQPSIFGEIEVLDGGVAFKPIIPFTPGLYYDVRIKDKSIARIKIPIDPNRNLPSLHAIYPSQDTLPLNLLKIYLEFDQPMREGQSIQFITLLDNGRDTISSVFLDLQPELWNRERTLMTIWLDPGRIKRDLQPNQRMGEPLKTKTPYKIVISKKWNDIHGFPLQRDYHKDFFVSGRDSLPPDPSRWTLRSPDAGTQDPVQINFHEAMDFVLLNEAVRITDSEGNRISGKTGIVNEETILSFTPDAKWTLGEYTLECESRLEDLAGNNLDRPFDRDLWQQSKRPPHDIYRKKFSVH